MSGGWEWWLVVGMALVTFAARYPMLALLSRAQLPAPLLRALTYVPIAVLSAIIAPVAVLRGGELAMHMHNPFFVATLFAVLVAWKSQNLLLTIVLGMSAFLLLQWWL